MEVHHKSAEPWKVTLVDTGEQTQTGGRLKRIKGYLPEEEDFCFTYGDGLADVNIDRLVTFHKSQGTLGSLTAIQPPGRFGALDLEKTRIRGFTEKPPGDSAWINGGFFVLSPRVLDYIEATTPVGKENRWRGWLKKDNCQPISIMDSGSAWIRYGTGRNSKRFGTVGRLPGKSGHEQKFLARQKRFYHRSHGV